MSETSNEFYYTFIPHLTLKYSYFEIDLFRLFLTLTKSIKMRKREGGF